MDERALNRYAHHEIQELSVEVLRARLEVRGRKRMAQKAARMERNMSQRERGGRVLVVS